MVVFLRFKNSGPTLLAYSGPGKYSLVLFVEKLVELINPKAPTASKVSSLIFCCNSDPLIFKKEASFLKIRGSELQQKISELTLEAVGAFGLINSTSFSTNNTNEYFPGPEYANNVGPEFLNLRKTTIYGGSNEIQKNILTKMVLGL